MFKPTSLSEMAGKIFQFELYYDFLKSYFGILKKIASKYFGYKEWD